MSTITVNGKFLAAGLDGGVHRTAARFTGQLVRRAEAAGHRVRIVVPGPIDPTLAVGDLTVGDLVGDRLQVVPSRAGRGQAWEMVALPRAAAGTLLVSFANLAPVAHANSVVMIHDAQTLMFPRHYPRRQALGYKVLLPLIGRRARRVLTVSAFSRGALDRYGVADEAKIDVVPNGTDHLLGVASRPDVLARHGLAPQGYVLALGSQLPYKNLRLLFDALRAEPDAPGGLRLAVAGGPPPATYRTQGLVPPPGTVFTGPVDDGELRALYEGAAVFAYPSLTEGFGLPPVEAMHCGAPVVAARAGAIPEVCGPDAAVLLDPADTDGWRRTLHEVATGGPHRDELVARGRQRAAGLSWAAAGDRLWHCLQPLL